MKKKPTTSGEVRITFELPAAIEANTANLCGDFNDWSRDTHPMRRRKDGTFAATLRLPEGQYQYRYLLDGDRWVNDWNADDYLPNGYGSDNSVVIIPPPSNGQTP